MAKAITEVKLSGMVTEVIPFRASLDKTGVLKIRDSMKRLVSVVGTIDGILYGDFVDVTGIERMHPTHGLQVKATTIRTTYPTTIRETREWLLRHLRTEARDVDAMLADWKLEWATEWIEPEGMLRFWERACREDAILKACFTRNNLEGDWFHLVLHVQQKSVMDDLVELGLDTKEAFALFKALGMKAATQLREDPYTVYYYVETTPFEKIDKIYLRRPDTLKTDDRRVRALCMNRVRDFVESGDTAVRYDDLIDLLEEKHDYIKARVLIENLHELEPEFITFYSSRYQGILVQPRELAQYEANFAKWLVTGQHPENHVMEDTEDELTL